VLAESINFSGLFTGNYTDDESSKGIEKLTVKDTLAVSLKGTISGGKIGDFKVISVEASR
jgi:hypothetical protein